MNKTAIFRASHGESHGEREPRRPFIELLDCTIEGNLKGGRLCFNDRLTNCKTNLNSSESILYRLSYDNITLLYRHWTA